MHIINITVRNKVAVNPAQDRYVCGNSDYVVRFDFDAEWDAYDTKTARLIKEDGTVYDQVFSGNECPVPVIADTYKLMVGVFAGNLSTTTAAYVPCKKSILCRGGVPAAPAEDVYSQIMAKLNSLDGGVSDPGQAHQQLVSDAEGKAAWKPREFYTEDGMTFPWHMTVDADAPSAMIIYNKDGSETGIRWVKVSDYTPDVERVIGHCTVQINEYNTVQITAGNIIDSTEDGYQIALDRISISDQGVEKTLRTTYAVVCKKAGYITSGHPGHQYPENNMATLPEPGLYLPVGIGLDHTAYGLNLDEYVQPLDDKYIPDNIARKDDIKDVEIPEPVSDDHINSLIDARLHSYDAAYILPETVLVALDDRMCIPGAWASLPVVGNVYTVVCNGAKYDCECIAVPDNPDTPSGTFLMGNLAVLGMEGLVGNPDAPFVLMGFPEAMDGVTGFFTLMDGVESVTLAIMSKTPGYYFFDGSTARLVTIEQLKADLGLT